MTIWGERSTLKRGDDWSQDLYWSVSTATPLWRRFSTVASSSYAPPAAHGGRKRQRQESEGMIPTSDPRASEVGPVVERVTLSEL